MLNVIMLSAKKTSVFYAECHICLKSLLLTVFYNVTLLMSVVYVVVIQNAFIMSVISLCGGMLKAGNTKGGSITVQLTSSYTGWD